MRLRLSVLIAIAVSCAQAAEPLSFQELDLMVRLGTAEPEIVNAVQSRHLLQPLDPAQKQKLAADGASKALVEKIAAGNFALSASAAETEMARQKINRQIIENERARDAADYAALLAKQRAQPSASASSAAEPTNKIAALLNKRLVRAQNGALAPYGSGNLNDCKIFAFYSSASWCGPCKKFTPELVRAYAQWKTAHPEFELILLSGDKSDSDMAAYVSEEKITFPVVPPNSVDASLRPFVNESIPFLVAVNEKGAPLFPDRKLPVKWFDPSETAGWLMKALH